MEGLIGSPRPLGEGLGVKAYNFCQSMRWSPVLVAWYINSPLAACLLPQSGAVVKAFLMLWLLDLGSANKFMEIRRCWN